MDLNKIMDNENNMYYGHGTGGNGSTEIVNSIMENGLRCSRGSLYYTSNVLCKGNKVNSDIIETLKNWKHMESKLIIIVSLPIKYNICFQEIENSAFYYIPSSKQQEKYKLTNSEYVMPEFIRGYYDAINDTFVSNPKYYEFLSNSEQEELFDQVKLQYIKNINQVFGDLESYQEMLNNLPGWEYPLNNSDVEKAKKTNCFNLLKNLNIDKIDKKVIIDGKEMNIDDYIWEYVYPFLPKDGIILMKDNSIHMIDDFVTF